MNFKETVAGRESSDLQLREQGMKNLTAYLERIVKRRKDVSGADSPISLLAKMDFEEFILFIERINGILKEVPVHDREAFSHDSAVVSTLLTSETPEMIPPPRNIRESMMKEIFDKLLSLASGEPKEKRDIAPFLTFNAIIYLHPFVDGNGRTARTAFRLLSSDRLEDFIVKIRDSANVRSDSLKRHHENVNLYTYHLMLLERGIDWQDHGPDERSVWPYLEDNDPGVGFDKSGLRFLAAFDAMSMEERKKYMRINDFNAHSFDMSEIPDEIIERIRSGKDKIREEFVRSVMHSSANPEGYFKTLVVELQEILS